MPLVSDLDGERLRLERASRAAIQRIYEAVLSDRWDTVWSVWTEARAQGEWFAVSVWAGLPNTVRARLREMDDATRRPD